MKYDEAGREKLFKYDKIRESPSPFIKNKSSSWLRLSLKKSGFKTPRCGVAQKALWCPKTYSKGILMASSHL